MYTLGFDQRDLNVFSTAFLKSGMPSIDAFLARRGKEKVGNLTNQTFSDIGKAAIAFHLIQREEESILHSFPVDHWYQYVWSFMADSLDAFGDNQLRVITFNYDRSFEYYLLTALQHSFGISSLEAAQHLRKIPILHVYGELGKLPDLADDGCESRFYRPDLSDPAFLAAAARGIRVIDESRDDDDIFDQAYAYLKNSKKICFLGFGFDNTNMRRLRIDKLMAEFRELRGGEPSVYATTLGLEDAERSQVMSRLRASQYSWDHVKNVIGSMRHLKIEQYLRATGVLLL